VYYHRKRHHAETYQALSGAMVAKLEPGLTFERQTVNDVLAEYDQASLQQSIIIAPDLSNYRPRFPLASHLLLTKSSSSPFEVPLTGRTHASRNG
jgi:hypothetical protein